MDSRSKFSSFDDENIADEFNLDIKDRDVFFPKRTGRNFLPEAIVSKILEKCVKINDKTDFSNIPLRSFVCYFLPGGSPRNERFFSGYIINFGMDRSLESPKRDRFVLSPHQNFNERNRKKQKTFCWSVKFNDIGDLFYRFGYEGQMIMKSMVRLGKRVLNPTKKTLPHK